MDSKTIFIGFAITVGVVLLATASISPMDMKGFGFYYIPRPSTTPTTTSSCLPAPPSSTSYYCTSSQTSGSGSQTSTQTCSIVGTVIVGSCNNISKQTSVNSGTSPTSSFSTISGVPPSSVSPGAPISH